VQHGVIKGKKSWSTTHPRTLGKKKKKKNQKEKEVERFATRRRLTYRRKGERLPDLGKSERRESAIDLRKTGRKDPYY